MKWIWRISCAVLVASVEITDLLPAQVSEAAVADSLREVLGVPRSERLDLDRTYDRVFFPSAIFYRAQYVRTDISHSSPVAAGAIVVDNRTLVVRSFRDLNEAWKANMLNPPNRPLTSEEFGAACASLVRHSGLLWGVPRFITRSVEIPKTALLGLQERDAIRRIDRAGRRVKDSGGAAFLVWDGDVLQFTCNNIGSGLGLQVDTIAKGWRNTP